MCINIWAKAYSLSLYLCAVPVLRCVCVVYLGPQHSCWQADWRFGPEPALYRPSLWLHSVWTQWCWVIWRTCLSQLSPPDFHRSSFPWGLAGSLSHTVSGFRNCTWEIQRVSITNKIQICTKLQTTKLCKLRFYIQQSLLWIRLPNRTKQLKLYPPWPTTTLKCCLHVNALEMIIKNIDNFWYLYYI